jgi:hypothetical protein
MNEAPIPVNVGDIIRYLPNSGGQKWVDAIVMFTDPNPNGICITTNKGGLDGMLLATHKIVRTHQHTGGGHYVACKCRDYKDISEFSLQAQSRMTIDGNTVTDEYQQSIAGLSMEMQGIVTTTAVGGHLSETDGGDSDDTPPRSPILRTSAQRRAQAILDSPTPKITRNTSRRMSTASIDALLPRRREFDPMAQFRFALHARDLFLDSDDENGNIDHNAANVKPNEWAVDMTMEPANNGSDASEVSSAKVNGSGHGTDIGGDGDTVGSQESGDQDNHNRVDCNRVDCRYFARA